MPSSRTKTHKNQSLQIIHHGDEPSITIWQSHLMICDAARQPACAAAILDLFERFAKDMHDQNAEGGWVTLSYEDIYFELFEMFWLNNIKHHMRWLVERGFLERGPVGDNDEFGTYAYRFASEAIAKATAQLGNNIS